jgi:hypothetical protein
MFVFSADGRMGRVPVHRLPEASEVHPSDRGVFHRNDRLVSLHLLSRAEDGEEEENGRYLVLATRDGRVKRVAMSDVWSAIGVTTAMNVEDGDELIGVELSDGDAEIVLVTKLGQAIRFKEDEVRAMGLAAAGVWGIKLSSGDEVVSLCVTRPDAGLVVVTTAGYFKRTDLKQYSIQRRHGSGLAAIRLGQRSGAVADARVALPGDEFFSASRKGTLRKVDFQEIPSGGRSTMGKLLIQPAKNDTIAKLLHLPTTRPRRGRSNPPGDSPAPPQRTRRRRKPASTPASSASSSSRTRRRSAAKDDGAGPTGAASGSRTKRTRSTRTSKGATAKPARGRTTASAAAKDEPAEATAKPSRRRTAAGSTGAKKTGSTSTSRSRRTDRSGKPGQSSATDSAPNPQAESPQKPAAKPSTSASRRTSGATKTGNASPAAASGSQGSPDAGSAQPASQTADKAKPAGRKSTPAKQLSLLDKLRSVK